MTRRRFQSPKPFKEGQFLWLRVWDTNLAGSRKRQRIKLAPAGMPVREVQKIAEEKLRPVNQGLILTGSAMNFDDFVNGTYLPTYLPLLSSNTQDSYRGALEVFGAKILAIVSARPDAAHDTAVFLRYGGEGGKSPNLQKQGRIFFHPPPRGRCGVFQQEPDGRTAAATGQTGTAAQADHHARAV